MRWRARLRRWLVAALLVVGVGTAGASPFEADALKTLALGDVIRLATARYRAVEFVDDAADRAARLEDIAALDPEVRTLLWLAMLQNGLSEQTEANRQAPSQYVGARRWDANLGAALAEAGLADRAAIFARAAAARRPPPDGSTVETLSLGPAFGSKAAFAAAVEAYARSHPAAAAWCEAARAHLREKDRLLVLLERLRRRAETDGMRGWPEPYRALMLADTFAGEVDMGGLHQFFANPSGDAAPETVAALRAVGLPLQAEAAAKAIDLFPKPYPTDRETRKSIFADDDTDRDRQLRALTRTVAVDAVRPALISYARQRELLPR